MPNDAVKQRVVRLRHETAVRYHEQAERHGAEDRELVNEYCEELLGLGLSEGEIAHEYILMINEATPGADQHRYRIRELLRRHRAGKELSPEELEEVEAVLKEGDEDIYLNWRSEAEKEAGR